MDRHEFSGIINEDTMRIVNSGCFKVQDKIREGRENQIRERTNRFRCLVLEIFRRNLMF